MNKKLLICGAIATALLITACVKKEEPKQEEQEQVDTSASDAQPAEPAKFESLDSADNQPIEPVPAHQDVIREETPNTTTEIRREVRDTKPAEEAPKSAAPKAEAPKAEDKPTQAAPKQNSSSAQTEDDAVAAAIAAATPALDN